MFSVARPAAGTVKLTCRGVAAVLCCGGEVTVLAALAGLSTEINSSKSALPLVASRPVYPSAKYRVVGGPDVGGATVAVLVAAAGTLVLVAVGTPVVVAVGRGEAVPVGGG